MSPDVCKHETEAHYTETVVTRKSALDLQLIRGLTEPFLAAVRPTLMTVTRTRANDRPAARTGLSTHKWLLFVHQLPARPTSLRVRTWRRLQQIGAIAVKQAVYVLPDSPNAREDFEWLKAEIEGSGGQASVFAADTVDTWSNDALVEEFRKSREEAYGTLAREADQLLRRFTARRRKSARLPSRRALQQFRERLCAIERVDFFGSAGRDRVLTLLAQIEERASAKPRARTLEAKSDLSTSYKARLWVTRPRPGVDRMASAWLIKRFIDGEARFEFVADRDTAPPDSVPFDMFGVEFTHRGPLCTFEMLCETFQLAEPALASIAAIVHDLDLKDGRFGATNAPTIGLVIEGLRLAQPDDHQLLSEGMALFEALYRAFMQANLSSGPRPVARRTTKNTRGGGKRR